MSAGRFATKTGANDSTDLQYDSLSETGFYENELDNSAANFLASRATISPRAVGWRIPQNMKSFFGLMGSNRNARCDCIPAFIHAFR